MTKQFTLLILLAHLLALNCQEQIVDVIAEQQTGEHSPRDHDRCNAMETYGKYKHKAKPSYSFSYGVSDANTGDIKTVWESKEGDTVKGHYSVLEPDGTVRSVEYSAGPKTGFTAVVNNDGVTPPEPETVPETGRSFMEDKTMRDYGKYYDFADEIEDDYYERKRAKRPYDPFREAPPRKRPNNYDQEPSEYTHSVTIKHPREETSHNDPHSHVGYSFDPNCKTKTKKESHDGDSYANIVYHDQNKQKYPNYPPEPYRDSYDKYSESSNYAFDRVKPYESHKIPKYDDHRSETSLKYHYQTIADIPRPEKYYPEDNIPSRPKKNRRPPKVPEFLGEDMDDYILVPKKKYKPSRRPSEPIEYRPEFDDEFDRPYGYDDEDRYRPLRESTGPEVVRKVVKKKKKPVVNLLDIFDI